MGPIIASIVKFATSTAGGKLLDKVTTGGLINNVNTAEPGFPIGRINWVRFGKTVLIPIILIICATIIISKGGDATALIEAATE